MTAKQFSFTTVTSHDGWVGTIVIPDEIAEELKRLKIKRCVATVNAGATTIEFHCGILSVKGMAYIMLSKEKQKELNVELGSSLDVKLVEDTSKYQAPMTEEFEAVLLSDPEGEALFDSLLPGKQRNIIFMVNKPKSSQKRIDLALNALENLKAGNMEPMKFEKLIDF